MKKIDMSDPELWTLPPPQQNRRGRHRRIPRQPPPPQSQSEDPAGATPNQPLPSPKRRGRPPGRNPNPTPNPIPTLGFREEPHKQQPTPFVAARYVKIREVAVTKEMFDEIKAIATATGAAAQVVLSELLARGLADYRANPLLTTLTYRNPRGGKPKQSADTVLPTATARQYRPPRIGEED